MIIKIGYNLYNYKGPNPENVPQTMGYVRSDKEYIYVIANKKFKRIKKENLEKMYIDEKQTILR